MKDKLIEEDSFFYGKKAVKVFFILVIILSAGTEAAYCLGAPGWLVAVLMWIPALSAIIAATISIKEKNEAFTIRKLFSGVAFSLIMKDLVLYTIVSVIIGLLTATGEELGWRGFMLPALLERFGLKKALLLSGLIWCLWHFPLLIWGGYMDDSVLWYRLIAFVLCIFPVGVIAGLLAIKSGSVWPAAFLHAAHNAYDQSVFGIITRGDNMMYYVSETGILTIVCAWIIAAILYAAYSKAKIIHKENGNDG